MTEGSSFLGRGRGFAVIALALAAGGLLFLAASGVGKNLVYYWGPTELEVAGAAANGASIRLGGQVVAGSVRQVPGATELDFAVTDGKATTSVHARGLPPPMFREGIGVVVEGTRLADGRFEGRRLMVSHGNEYRAPKPGEAVDIEQAIRSASPAEP